MPRYGNNLFFTANTRLTLADVYKFRQSGGMKTTLKTTPRIARSLDHLILPTADLDVAKARLEALGFIVAAKGVHPFGTENACVFFADGTFLEPLAIGHRETAEAASLKGNQFTARDAAFRFRRGVEGFSSIVMASDNANEDAARFTAAGISGGDVLEFGRDFETPAGEKSRMDFRLAFAADLRSPDFFGVTCQRINVPKADRSKLITHANGVTSIQSVILTEANPTDFQYLFQELINEREVDAHSFGMDIKSTNATISVLTPEGFEVYYGGHAGSHARGIIARAVVFGCVDLTDLEATLKAQSIDFYKHLGRILVKPAAGQGALFAFEAAR
jgi:catechol 2,3-dioxygenase-like lactoylglutathione lyase family enzyme